MYNTELDSFIRCPVRHAINDLELNSALLDPGLFFSFEFFFYTDGRPPWAGDQPVASFGDWILKTEIGSSLRNAVSLNINRTVF
jgi:hypothetical protein